MVQTQLCLVEASIGNHCYTAFTNKQRHVPGVTKGGFGDGSVVAFVQGETHLI